MFIFTEPRRGRVRERTRSRSASRSGSRGSSRGSESEGNGDETVMSLGAKQQSTQVGKPAQESTSTTPSNICAPEQTVAEQSCAVPRQPRYTTGTEDSQTSPKAASPQPSRAGLSLNASSLPATSEYSKPVKQPPKETSLASTHPSTRARLPGQFMLKAAGSESSLAVGKSFKRVASTQPSCGHSGESAALSGPLDNMDVIPCPSNEIAVPETGRAPVVSQSGFGAMNGVKADGGSPRMSVGVASGVGQRVALTSPPMGAGRGVRLAAVLASSAVEAGETVSLPKGAVGRAQRWKSHCSD